LGQLRGIECDVILPTVPQIPAACMSQTLMIQRKMISPYSTRKARERNNRVPMTN